MPVCLSQIGIKTYSETAQLLYHKVHPYRDAFNDVAAKDRDALAWPTIITGIIKHRWYDGMLSIYLSILLFKFLCHITITS